MLNNCGFRNLFSANALSPFVILIPISLDESFLTLDMAPKCWNSLTFSKTTSSSSSSVFSSFSRNFITFVFSLLMCVLLFGCHLTGFLKCLNRSQTQTPGFYAPLIPVRSFCISPIVFSSDLPDLGQYLLQMLSTEYHPLLLDIVCSLYIFWLRILASLRPQLHPLYCTASPGVCCRMLSWSQRIIAICFANIRTFSLEFHRLLTTALLSISLSENRTDFLLDSLPHKALAAFYNISENIL